MRIYNDCRELISEIRRDVWEMGQIVWPHSMQNKVVKDNEDFLTKEIICYNYCLLSLNNEDVLFSFDERSKEWCKEEFKERVSLTPINPGEAWKIRPELWKQFLVLVKKAEGYHEWVFDYTYNERIKPSSRLKRLIQELKDNPDSRQCILSIWFPEDIGMIGGKARVPCSIYYSFLLRDGKLHMTYKQRSADVVTHFGNDIWLAWAMKNYVAKQVGVEPGYLYHTIDSLHCYKKDWEILKNSISNG